MGITFLAISIILLGIFIYNCTKTVVDKPSTNNGTSNSSGIEYSDVKLSAQLVYWKQQGVSIKHKYYPDDDTKDQVAWWSDFAYEDNVAWPITGMTSFYLGFNVRNLGDTSAIFGTDPNALRLWLVDNYNNRPVNTGYVRNSAGYVLIDTSLAAGESTTYYTELVDMPTLIEGSIRWYDIYYGTTFDKRKKIGSLIIEGALKADFKEEILKYEKDING